MPAFIVLSPEGRSAFDPENRFIKDGFSITAALFPVIYAIARGLYLDALFLFALQVAASLLVETQQYSIFGWSLLIATSLIFAFEARQRHANRLAGNGWLWQAAISARNLEEAEEVYYARMENSASRTAETFRFDEEKAGGRTATTTAAARPHAGFGLIDFEKGRR